MMCCGRKALNFAVDFEYDTTLRVHECRLPCTDQRAMSPSFYELPHYELPRSPFQTSSVGLPVDVTPQFRM